MVWDVLSGVTTQHGMFCPGWQIFVGCFVRGVKKWHGMFRPSMFCPAPKQNIEQLQTPTMGVTINNMSTKTEPPP